MKRKILNTNLIYKTYLLILFFRFLLIILYVSSTCYLFYIKAFSRQLNTYHFVCIFDAKYDMFHLPLFKFYLALYTLYVKFTSLIVHDTFNDMKVSLGPFVCLDYHLLFNDTTQRVSNFNAASNCWLCSIHLCTCSDNVSHSEK